MSPRRMARRRRAAGVENKNLSRRVPRPGSDLGALGRLLRMTRERLQQRARDGQRQQEVEEDREAEHRELDVAHVDGVPDVVLREVVERHHDRVQAERRGCDGSAASLAAPRYSSISACSETTKPNKRAAWIVTTKLPCRCITFGFPLSVIEKT